jgi:DNA polymerase-1
MRLVFDIEADSLTPTKVHCLVITNVDTLETKRFANMPFMHGGIDSIPNGCELLKQADLIIGHNILGYDLPVLKKFYGLVIPIEKVCDTYLTSMLVVPEREEGHSLEAWGRYLGHGKIKYDGPWDQWSKVMEDYCAGDVKVTLELFNWISDNHSYIFDTKAFALEHNVAVILQRQCGHGVLFDVDGAIILYKQLKQEAQDLEKDLKEMWKPIFVPYGRIKTPKNTLVYSNKLRMSFTEGASYQPIKLQEFNPSSRSQIIYRFKKYYNWKPIVFTINKKTGERTDTPKISDDILDILPYKEAEVLSRYSLLTKRLSFLKSNNKKSKGWLELFDRNSRIHGSIKQNGTVTGRMSHYSPNLSQVPSAKKPYGKECRSLFIVPKNKVMLGIDADALELRCLAGYLYRYDNGEFMKRLVTGKKEDGTDIHTLNARVLDVKDREIAKTFIYMLIYGGGNLKAGYIILGRQSEEVLMVRGKEYKNRFLNEYSSIKYLTNALKSILKKRRYLVGLDGRRLYIRKDYAAINTLLQSAGAVIMKQALVLADQALQEKGLIPGKDYEWILNIHDEFQVEVDEHLGELCAKIIEPCFERAGKNFNFPCPIKGNWKLGKNWAETH